MFYQELDGKVGQSCLMRPVERLDKEMLAGVQNLNSREFKICKRLCWQGCVVSGASETQKCDAGRPVSVLELSPQSCKKSSGSTSSPSLLFKNCYSYKRGLWKWIFFCQETILLNLTETENNSPSHSG